MKTKADGRREHVRHNVYALSLRWRQTNAYNKMYTCTGGILRDRRERETNRKDRYRKETERETDRDRERHCRRRQKRRVCSITPESGAEAFLCAVFHVNPGQTASAFGVYRHL